MWEPGKMDVGKGRDRDRPDHCLICSHHGTIQGDMKNRWHSGPLPPGGPGPDPDHDATGQTPRKSKSWAQYVCLTYIFLSKIHQFVTISPMWNEISFYRENKKPNNSTLQHLNFCPIHSSALYWVHMKCSGNLRIHETLDWAHGTSGCSSETWHTPEPRMSRPARPPQWGQGARVPCTSARGHRASDSASLHCQQTRTHRASLKDWSIYPSLLPKS